MTDQPVENLNKWASDKNSFATWEAEFSITRNNFSDLYDIADKVLLLGQQHRVFDILEIAGKFVFAKDNGLTYGQHMAKIAEQTGKIIFFTHYSDVKAVTDICFFDQTGKIVEEPIRDVGVLMDKLKGPPIRYAKPVDVGGDVLTIDKLSDVPQKVNLWIELYTDIWFPKVEDTYGIYPASRYENMIDNRALAQCHTPRLNQFIQGVRAVAESYGATWKLRLEYMGYEYPRLGMYLRMLTDNGIVLDE